MNYRITKFVEASWPNLERNSSYTDGSSDETVTDRETVFKNIVDRFESLGEVTTALKKVNLKDCGLIFGIL